MSSQIVFIILFVMPKQKTIVFEIQTHIIIKIKHVAWFFMKNIPNKKALFSAFFNLLLPDFVSFSFYNANFECPLPQAK
jgi:hypothetical protein